MRVLSFATVALLVACADSSSSTEDSSNDGDSDDVLSDTDDSENGVDSDLPIDTTDEPLDTDVPPDDDTDQVGDDTDEPTEDDACPDDVICVDTFPFSHASTTTAAASDVFDSYGCATTTNESGPEVLYRVDVPDDGFLALDLPQVAGDADVDIHLLASFDADDCLDRGHWRAGDLVSAGRYWVVADSWVNGSGDVKDGSYTLTFGLTTADGLAAEGMSKDAASDALTAFDTAWGWEDTDRFEYAITDFSLSSSLPREWVLDLATGGVLWNLYVAHGEGSSDPSDSRYAVSFSNVNDSHKSSLGMMRAAETYSGSYGYSMRIDGLEDDYNDAVRSRAIVVHPWTGSRQEYVNAWGETAETWGCPGIDDRLAEDVIDTLSDGALLFFWYPDGDWSEDSTYLE